MVREWGGEQADNLPEASSESPCVTIPVGQEEGNEQGVELATRPQRPRWSEDCASEADGPLQGGFSAGSDTADGFDSGALNSSVVSDDLGLGTADASEEYWADQLARLEVEYAEYKLRYESGVSWLKDVASSNQPLGEAASLLHSMRKELACLEHSMAPLRRQCGSAGGSRCGRVRGHITKGSGRACNR